MVSKPTTLWAAWPALFALCLTMLVEMVDNSILTVALPTIGRDIGAGTTGLQWILGAYSLTFGGLLMVGGMLGDRFGRRRMLLVGLVGFGLASLLVLFAHSEGEVIAVRALCGAFAALVAPGTMSLLFRLFDDETLRRRAIGLIIGVVLLGIMIGPALGGFAIEHVSWQTLLTVNAPVALIAWLGVRYGIERDEKSQLRGGAVDVWGGVFSVSSLALLILIFTLAVNEGWLSPLTLIAIFLTLASFTAFVLREQRCASPMINLRLFLQPTVRGSALLQMAVMIALIGVSFSSTQVFQYAWGWTPLRSGLATLPLVMGMFAASPLTDVLVKHRGHRITAAVGSVALIGALTVLIFTLQHYWGFALALLLLAAGMRLVMTTCAVALVEALPEDHTGIGSALNDTAQEVGNAVGVAIVGTLTAALIGVSLPQGHWSSAFSQQFIQSQRGAFTILLALVVTVSVVGVRTLTDSRTVED